MLLLLLRRWTTIWSKARELWIISLETITEHILTAVTSSPRVLRLKEEEEEYLTAI
jgi:hypothetical protein